MDRDMEAYRSKLEESARGTFWETLGCKLEKLEAGRVVVSLLVTERHLNHIGILHGGVHASLLDNTMGIAAMLTRPGEKVVTTNLNVHYLATLGQGRIVATAELIYQSRSTITVQGKIEDEQGMIGSWGSGTFRVSAGHTRS